MVEAMTDLSSSVFGLGNSIFTEIHEMYHFVLFICG